MQVCICMYITSQNKLQSFNSRIRIFLHRYYFELNATIMGLKTESRKTVTKPSKLNALVDSNINHIS